MYAIVTATEVRYVFFKSSSSELRLMISIVGFER